MRKLLLPLRLAWWTVTLQLPRRLRLRADKRLLLESGSFDPAFYLQQNPDVAQAGINPVEHYLATEAATSRNPNALFDTAWYLAQNPDVTTQGLNPLLHYLRQGLKQGRSPNPLFDVRFYLEQNRDVAAAGIDPLMHYMTRGWREHRNPHPFFDVAFYLKRYSDIAQAGSEPLAHYLRCGGIEGRDPHPVLDGQFYLAQHPEAGVRGLNPLLHFLRPEGGTPNRYFDVAFYLEQNPDVPETAVDAVRHYLREGAAQGRNPHPLFDTHWYVSTNPEVTTSGENPLLHFLQRGWREGRDPHPLFDTKFYLRHRPDVIAANIIPAYHYLLSGGAEGRDPHPLFDSDWYLAQIPDAAKAGENPLLHYLRRGWKEKRSPCAFFDGAFYLEHNPDVAEGKISSLHHYLVYGAAKGRDPSPWFHTDWYVAQNPDIVTAGWNPLVHYVQVGMREGRRMRPLIETRKAASPAKHRRPRIVFISGEPETPGHRYRVLNIARALSPRFFETVVMTSSDLPRRMDEIAEADIVWIWRARLSPETASLMTAARQAGAAILFDVDDLMFRPELAVREMIDGIRAQKISEADVRNFYGDIRLMLLEADRCTAPTIPLAREIRALHKPASVIPNGFDRETLELARSAMRKRRSEPDDGLVRIGYASGTLTHQRDFAVASQPIAAVLRDNPSARLVLFRGGIEIDEFPELQNVREQIEWRDRVPLQDLPREYARFDINIAPLEVGNRYCEAKSELKFFEAALAGVPTVASPTQPFMDAVRPGDTAFLAATGDQWYQSLSRLVHDRDMRRMMADRAYQDVAWLYGPERRNLLVTRLVNEFLAPEPLRFDLFRFEMQTDSAATLPPIAVPEYDVLFQSERRGNSRVSVVIPVFNYERLLEEALESVRQQTLRGIDVVVVDDRSTDNSAAVAYHWLVDHAAEFNMVALLQNRRNSKLGQTRNAAVSFSDTEIFMALDADNALLPDCLEKCMAALDQTGAAFVYPTISLFGDRTGQIGLMPYDPALLPCANYIDAMAMVRKACWIAVGGYSPLDPMGWEDYEFWCKLAEKGLFGVRLEETAARYRTHDESMLRTITNLPENRPRVVEDLNRHHPWLQLRVSDSIEDPSRAAVASRLTRGP